MQLVHRVSRRGAKGRSGRPELVQPERGRATLRALTPAVQGTERSKRLGRCLAPAYLWLEDHGWSLAKALAAVAILAGIALALAGQ